MPGPFDIQVNLPRTIETQRIEPIRQGHIVTEQQEKSRQAIHEAQLQQQQVQTSTQTSSQLKVKTEQERKKHKQPKKKFRNYQSSGQMEKAVEEEDEHKIDIKI